MKIVQSFWSKPFQNSVDEDFYIRSRGGFPLKRYYIYAHALSILQLNKMIGEVHLITDEYGKELLIDMFQLPYSSYSTELDQFDETPTHLWAVSKVYVYSIMREPTIHIDNDLIVGKKFEYKLLDNEIIVEFGYKDKPNRYGQQIQNILKSNAKFPEELLSYLRQKNFVYSDYNLGIVGGRDYSFFSEFGKKSLYWFFENRNINLEDKPALAFMNCLLEPCYFFQQLVSSDREVTLCLDSIFDQDVDYQKVDMASNTMNFKFVHFHNAYKLHYYQRVEDWLRASYPDEYCHINQTIAGLAPT